MPNGRNKPALFQLFLNRSGVYGRSRPNAGQKPIPNRKTKQPAPQPTNCAPKSKAAWLASTGQTRRREILSDLDARALQTFLYDWPFWAAPAQLPPTQPPDWTAWVFIGGRGAGKTRAGAEWVRSLVARAAKPLRLAFVAETYHDARAVMVEGSSGLLAITPYAERPKFLSSLRRLEWPGGSVAELFSSEDPDGLRGPQFHYAWCDELAKWKNLETTWTMLQLALRLGDHPRQIVTTTPRPLKLLVDLLAEKTTAVTRATTYDNAAHLGGAFLAHIVKRFEGTDLGRQELLGDLLTEDRGALFRRDWIDSARVKAAPSLRRIVVGVDPPATSGPEADECGIIAAGLGQDGQAYVLADRSVQGLSPMGWARRVVETFHDLEADHIVAEVNQGGEMVSSLIAQADPTCPVRCVYARRGKYVRAEPVAALYEKQAVHHVGGFAALEDQMAAFTGEAGRASPDRVDALVWALRICACARRRPHREAVPCERQNKINRVF